MVNVAVPKLGIAVAVAIGLFVSSTVGALIQHAPTLNLGWIRF